MMNLSFEATVAGAIAVLATAMPAPAQERFDLRNDERVNLHHFLVNWASEEAGERPFYATPLQEHEAGLDGLSDAERAAWGEAVSAYAATVGRSFVFDAGMVAVRDAAAGIGSAADVPAADGPLLAAIETALPVYRKHWWARQQAQNQAWIDALVPVLTQVEDGIAHRIVVAYGGIWPEGRTRIDVVAYPNAVGAYSTDGVVTIGSGDPGNQMPQAVEMVFHESSHIDPLETPLRAGVARAFEAEGRTAPERFWHDVVFYTSGEATRLELARIGRSGYEHYGASGVYRRGERWPPELAAFEAHWRPYLESGDETDAAREAALRRVAAALPDGD